MIKKYVTLGIVMTLVFSAGLVSAAKPDSTSPLTTVNPSEGRATVAIPAHAMEVAPGVFSLGAAIDNGRVVEGYAVITYKEGFEKPPGTPGNGPPDKPNGEDDTSDCYAFLAKGAKWKTVEPWVVNTANDEGLSSDFVFNNLVKDISKWEDAANGVVDDGISKDILGEGSTTTEMLVADMDSPDNKNEVYFADVDYENAIAIAIIWGIFGGPPGRRELVEWDMIFDDVDFDWSTTGESGKMDFENIATHEIGHAVGLADLYKDSCSEQTMYGYAEYGETKKSTLDDGDTNGVYQLYK